MGRGREGVDSRSRSWPWRKSTPPLPWGGGGIDNPASAPGPAGPTEYESESMSANRLAAGRIMTPSCLNVGGGEGRWRCRPPPGTGAGDDDDEVITFWSSGMIKARSVEEKDGRGVPYAPSSYASAHFPVTSAERRFPMFARSSSFTNEIEDGRLVHSECSEQIVRFGGHVT